MNFGGKMILFDRDAFSVEFVSVLAGGTWFLMMFLMSRSCDSDLLNRCQGMIWTTEAAREVFLMAK